MVASRFKAEAVGSRVSQTSLDALRLPRTGRTYDLSSGWWAGMPMLPAHPAFQLLTYRTPAGVRNQNDTPFLTDNNNVNLGFISEMIMCTAHSGTHIDALAHCTCGPDNGWYGNFSADTHLGDFGPLNSDASELPPMIGRGVMIDVAAALGVPHLEAVQPVGRTDLEAALNRQGTEIEPGDVVLIRTGQMSVWPDEARMAAVAGSGLTTEGAQWLVEREVSAVGADTVNLERTPSGTPGIPLPVHKLLIREHGIPILEWVYLEDLAREGVFTFLFVCLPLPIKGATGSMIRPLAIA